ncbi:MAG: MFS transporter, partial [Acidimicrobiales bacterium]
YMRSKMPESPRFVAYAAERARRAAAAPITKERAPRRGVRALLTDRRTLLLLLGTAGSWFFFDYAYYGNTLSLPVILKGVDPTGSTITKLALTLAMFVVFAVPGYLFAVWRMDRIGHRRLQLIGFAAMAAVFLVLGSVARLTSSVVPFVALFGVSYFFVQFGPNMTTFVLPSEVFPIGMRTTGHGMSAGLGKLGAFAGVFLVPILESGIGLRGMLIVAAGAAVLGIAMTTLLPEPARRDLEAVAGDSDLDVPERVGPLERIDPPCVIDVEEPSESALAV